MRHCVFPGNTVVDVPTVAKAERQRNHRASVLTELDAQLASLREGSAGEHSKRVCA